MNEHDQIAHRLREATHVEATPITPAAEIRRRGARRRRTRHTAIALSAVAVAGMLGGTTMMMLPHLTKPEVANRPSVPQVKLSPGSLQDPVLLKPTQMPNVGYLAGYYITGASAVFPCSATPQPLPSREIVHVDYALTEAGAIDFGYLSYNIMQFDAADDAKKKSIMDQVATAAECSWQTEAGPTSVKRSTVKVDGFADATVLTAENSSEVALVPTSRGVLVLDLQNQVDKGGQTAAAIRPSLLARAAAAYEGREVPIESDAQGIRAMPDLGWLPAGTKWSHLEMHQGQPPMSVAQCEPSLGWVQGKVIATDAKGPTRDKDEAATRARLTHHVVDSAAAATTARDESLTKFTTCLTDAKASPKRGEFTVDGVTVTVVLSQTAKAPDGLKAATTTLLWANGSTFGHVQVNTDQPLTSDPQSLQDLARAAIRQR